MDRRSWLGPLYEAAAIRAAATEKQTDTFFRLSFCLDHPPTISHIQPPQLLGFSQTCTSSAIVHSPLKGLCWAELGQIG